MVAGSMTTDTLTLTDFLLARIAEDEAMAEKAGSFTPWTDVFQNDNYGHLTVQPSRVLAECKAKRQIVRLGPSECSGYADQDEFNWKHYPDPDYSGHCDGCSASESADSVWRSALRALASIYADHADFDEAWAL